MASIGGLLGSQLQTTSLYTLFERLQKAEPTSKEYKELLDQLGVAFVTMASIINTKDTGIYNTYVTTNEPFLCNRQWFATQPQRGLRDSFRVVVNFGALPNAATTSVAHGIPFNGNNYILSRLEAYATDPVGYNYIPIPYAGAANSIEINLDQTNVNITTTTNRTAFTTCYVIIEYIPFS